MDRPLAMTEETEVEPASVAATGPETVHSLVLQAGRKSGATPIRRTFVQPEERERRRLGGPLAELVRHRDVRCLVLYLLALTVASKDPWDVERDARVWARSLDLGDSRSALQAVSKAWRRLRDLQLVEVARRGRRAAVVILREDGSGEPYDYPTPNKAEDRYLQLPLAFWLDGWYQRLSLAGLTMLLMLLAEKDGVALPIDRVPEWYGISRATAQRGLRELQEFGLLHVREVPKKAPQAALGFTLERHHHLLGAFARQPKPAQPAIASADPTPKPTPSARRRARRRAQTTSKHRREVKE